LNKVVEVNKSELNNITLRPETMGKKNEFGELEETILLCQNISQIAPCIDFAHIHARTGRFNSYREFISLFRKLEKRLGIKYIKNMHMHIAGIEYDKAKGEKYHLNLLESDFNFDELIDSIIDYNIEGTIVIESPDMIGDAIMLKKLYYEKL